MKSTIINILVFILFFNLIMLIFPDGKTQKYCKLTVKLILLLYIINNLAFNSSIYMDKFLDDFSLSGSNTSAYEREVSLNSIQSEFIELINETNFEGDDVVKNIILSFTNDMNVSATIYISRALSFDETERIKSNISEVFKINVENIELSM